MPEVSDRSALLVMDVQTGITSMVDAPRLLDRLAAAIAAARARRIPVIYVVVGFRAGYPEVNPANRSFSALRDSGRLLITDARLEVDAAVKPNDDDVVVTKRRVSAFAGSDLDVVLRAQNVAHLILTGIATSGVVLSTLRQAADLDFRLTVLSDACADGDSDVHRVLTEKVFPRQASVITVDEWVNG